MAELELQQEELSSEAIDKEVQSRTDALQFATKEEIEKCLASTGSTTMLHHYLKAFEKNPRVPAENIKAITQARTTVDHNILRAGINKIGAVPNNALNINVEKIKGQKNIVAWLLQSTRINLLKQQEVPAETAQLHEKAKTICETLPQPESSILDGVINQHLGIPLNHLALHAEVEDEALPDLIRKVNATLSADKMRIYIRNGVAILGGSRGIITVVDNAETRKNIFPKKKSNETPEAKTATAETKSQSAETTLAGLPADFENRLPEDPSMQVIFMQEYRKLAKEAERNGALIVSLKNSLSEAETMALEAVEKADGAEKLKSNLEKELETLRTQLSVANPEQLDKINKELAKLKVRLAQAEESLKISRAEARTAREEATAAKLIEKRLNQQLTAAKQTAADAEEARAAAMRKAGRGGVDIDQAKDKAKIHELEETIRRGNQDLASLRSQLNREKDKTTIHPEELARLKRASTELTGAAETIRNLQRQLAEKKSPAQPEQKDSAELAQLRAELAAKDAALSKAQQDLAISAQQVASLTEELGIANELLESATSSTPAPAKTPTQASAPKVTAVAAPAQAPKPREIFSADPIKEIDFRNGPALIESAKKALILLCGPHGLPKKKLNDLRQAINNKKDLDRWTAEAQKSVSIALVALKEKAKGDMIPPEEIQACVANLK